MKKKLESIKDLKFQALEKKQMMKILGGDCKTPSGTRTMGNGDKLNYSGDVTNSDAGGSDTKWFYGSGDAGDTEGYDDCGDC